MITVTECNVSDWVKQPMGLATLRFVDGPSPLLLGKASLQFDAPDKSFVRFRNKQYSGTPLSQITEFSYATYIEKTQSAADAPFIVLQVDTNGDSIFDNNLVFNPTYQTTPHSLKWGLPDQGAIQMKTWQTWDVLHGGWWIGPSPDPDNNGRLLTLATYINENPNAIIMNDSTKPVITGAAIRLTAGGPAFSGNFIGYVDDFRIGINGVTVKYDFEKSIANAGTNQTVIYGYGSNCTILKATPSGGVAPYTFLWSGGGIKSNNQNVQVCPTTNTTYTLTVTDANGCTGTDQVTIFVNDVRCGNKKDKVIICHKGKELCISPGAVPAHLNQGGYLGKCT
jgi:hypothetical protein